jgi:tRNA threonylcarbamoyladenosine biosynthesis protein TsaB
MRILAADTSTASGSVALMEGERIVLEWVLSSSRTHNRRLLKSIDDALNLAGWTIQSVDGFAVTVGPGSFTGLRIGLTTIKTLAWASGKAYVGVPSLDVLAATFAHSSLQICPLIDAHKKQVYGCLYHADSSGEVRPISSYRTFAVESIAEVIQERTLFCGDGWLLYGKALKESLGPLAVEAPASSHLIRAGVVAELARRRFERGETDNPLNAVPLYVRPSEAELKNPQLQVAGCAT